MKGSPDVLAAHEQLAGTPAKRVVVRGSSSWATSRGPRSPRAPPTWWSPTASPGTSPSSSSRGRPRPCWERSASARCPRTRAKLGGALLRPALRGLRDEIDPEGPGGAYLLGLRNLAVVCHGRFTRNGFANAIVLAERGVREQAVQRTHAALEAAGALRRRPPAATRDQAASETAASVTPS